MTPQTTLLSPGEGAPPRTSGAPIVVDLDGTLVSTDTLIESVMVVIKASPGNLFRLPFWLLGGRAGFKNALAARGAVSAERLPYRTRLLDYLREEKRRGRRIILATAAHEAIARDVANHLGLFDTVLATDGSRNLKGHAKLEAIQQCVDGEFVYVGDHTADIPIWKSASSAILVGASPRLAASVRQIVSVEREFPSEAVSLLTWMRALRIHQWLKNTLLFVPILTAFAFMDVSKLAATIVAFLAFSLAASATYVVNDLWDLESDRAHPRKKSRPFASGRIPILHGLAVAAAILLMALLLALTVSTGFFAMLILYLVVTSIYSWMLKEYVLIDVIVLSLLYTLRILAGSVAIAVDTSTWMLVFSVFLFLSLALMKRCAELVSLEQNGLLATRGRDYRVSDLTVLWPLGMASALSAVVVLGLFISAPETQSRYATSDLLWLLIVGMIYWLSRLWIKTGRSEMHDDPVVYAIRDRGSQIVIASMVVSVLVAHFVPLKDLV